MAVIRGNDFNNNLVGTSGSDSIYGYGGNDILDGRGGNDDLYGGAGNDDLIGGSGINDLYGGSGADWFVMSSRGGSSSDDLIVDFEFGIDAIDVSAWGVSDFSQIQALLRADSFGDATFNAYYNGYNHRVTLDQVRPGELLSSDFVFDASGARNMVGTQYGDVLFGSDYNDVIDGGSGRDILLGGNGSDDIFGGFDNDRLDGSVGSDDMNGESGADVVRGGSGNDIVIGGSGNDIVDGGASNDWVYGGSGDDDLVGGFGRDLLTGGPGFDAFIFNAPAQSQPGSARDVITDYQDDIDFFDVAAIDAQTNFSGNQSFDFIGGSAFSDSGQIRYFYSGDTTIIAGNIDLDSTAEFEFALQGRHVLGSGDFIL